MEPRRGIIDKISKKKVLKKFSKKMSKSFQSCHEIVKKESLQKIVKNYEK
jgi:hypothetical protein